MKESGPDAEDGKDDTHTHTQKRRTQALRVHTTHATCPFKCVSPLFSAGNKRPAAAAEGAALPHPLWRQPHPSQRLGEERADPRLGSQPGTKRQPTRSPRRNKPPMKTAAPVRGERVIRRPTPGRARCRLPAAAAAPAKWTTCASAPKRRGEQLPRLPPFKSRRGFLVFSLLFFLS